MSTMNTARPGRSLSETFGELPEPKVSVPVMMSACPATNSRPRNLPQFQEAARAADGDDVKEIDACEASDDMTLWCPDSKSWFTVESVQNDAATSSIYGSVPARTTIYIDDSAPGMSHWWVVDFDRPVVQRIPALACRSTPTPRIAELALSDTP